MSSSRFRFLSASIAFIALATLTVSCTEPVTPHILVFSKTDGYRHESISTGIEAIRQIGEQNGWVVDATEDASDFTDENLVNYQAVVFLNTTLNVLDKSQQNDFERFIQAGGGFVGVHAASDTEYDWPWYNGLVGAYFDSHPNNPNVRSGEVYVESRDHASMDSIPDRFETVDEFYNFRSIQPHINVLLKIDESTYEGGTNGDDHPMSWYHEYDGGRAFYTALGHTNEQYSNPLFVKHLEGGLSWALGGSRPRRVNYARATTLRVPEENRFTKVVLAESLDEPVELAVLPDNRVLFVERKGGIKLYDPQADSVELIHMLPVSHQYEFPDSGRDEGEDGLLGIALDPDFEENGWVYLFHSLAGDRAVNVLTRWDFRDGDVDEESMKIILEVPVQREQCCHTGGSIAFGPDGNLYVSTGDNTSPRGTAYAPIDERPGRMPWDAQKGSANANDLRGAILRITMQDDATYTIPEGNLFPPGTDSTRPEIYVMGTRNPYRISVDQKTGFVYWGDVGPDSRSPDSLRGPESYDEINQAREPGYFGWPYFVGPNLAYNDYDFATDTPGPTFKPDAPFNDSPNNTGLRDLPPAQPAFIYYPYGESEEWPILGSGGRTAMAGEVYYRDLYPGAERPFSEYYNGKLFIYEWVRGWILVATMDENGDLVEIEPFMPSYKFSNPMDMEFGPDGDLYLLEYGSGWFEQNPDARLVRIEYNDGNRLPTVNIAADEPKGAVPHTVQFSSDGTTDPDRDALRYDWRIRASDGTEIARFDEANPSFTFDEVGEYTAVLTVTDARRESASRELSIVAGNEPPVVTLDIEGNRSFFFPDRPLRYRASVTDLEDGEVPAERVSMTIDFLREGYDQVAAAQAAVAADELIEVAAGRALVAGSDCMACHQVDQASVGPMYLEVAERYHGDAEAGDLMIRRIIDGSTGVWGDVPMPAHPTLAIEDARRMASYILSIGTDTTNPNRPLEGEYTVASADMTPGEGTVILRASYEDTGANGMPAARTQQILTLRNPTISAGEAVDMDGVGSMAFGGNELRIGQSDGGWIAFEPFDFTGVTSLAFGATAPQNFGFVGGGIEARLDSPQGRLIGTGTVVARPGGPGAPPPPPVLVDIEPTEGEHALYVIYRSNSDAAGQLFVVANVTVVAR